MRFERVEVENYIMFVVLRIDASSMVRVTVDDFTRMVNDASDAIDAAADEIGAEGADDDAAESGSEE